MEQKIRTYSPDKELVKQKRKSIIQVACKIFIQKGYDRTTMQEIAEALNSSKGFLYHYLGAKEDILHSIIDETIEAGEEYMWRMRQEVETLPAEEVLYKAFHSLVEMVEEYSDMYIFNNHVMVNLGRADRQKMFKAQFDLRSFFESLINKYIAAGNIVMADIGLSAENFVALAHLWVQRRWFLQKLYTRDAYISHQYNMLMNQLIKG